MSKTILLVEDNASDEKLTVLAFQRANVAHTLVVKRDGAEALAYLADPAMPLPTVMLLDLKLPRVNGLDVLRRLRAEERTRILPVVVLTASRENEDVTASMELGANAYVRKPVDFGEFLEVAHTVGMFWLTLHEQMP